MAVPTVGNEREIGFENRSEVAARAVGQWSKVRCRACSRLFPWKYTQQVGVTVHREEQFLPAYCAGRSKAELNNTGISCAALSTLN